MMAVVRVSSQNDESGVEALYRRRERLPAFCENVSKFGRARLDRRPTVKRAASNNSLEEIGA